MYANPRRVRAPHHRRWRNIKMNTQENTSGLGIHSVLPEKLSSWNWGAFLLGPIWAFSHRCWIAILCFVPCINVAMPFVLAIKGNEWAWRNKKWKDDDHFHNVQKKWAIAGAITWALGLPIFVFSLMFMFKNSEPYRLTLAKVQQSEEVRQVLGTPIKPGLFVSGNLSDSGPNGNAGLAFSISGPLASGKAFSYAQKTLGQWSILQLVVDVPDKTQRIVLVIGKPANQSPKHTDAPAVVQATNLPESYVGPTNLMLNWKQE